MSVIQAFAIGAAFALVISLLTALALRPYLAELLEELCGSQARASFWMVLSGLSLFLVGILAGTVSYGYGAGTKLSPQELFFGLVTQVRAGLVGLLVSLLFLAWVLLGFVRRFEEGLIPTFNPEPETAGWRGGAVPAGHGAAPAPSPAPEPASWRREERSPEPTFRSDRSPEPEPTRWRPETRPTDSSTA
jgi:hypothetical protein